MSKNVDTLRLLSVLFASWALTACMTPQKQAVEDVRVYGQLSEAIELPIHVPVAYHATQQDLSEVLTTEEGKVPHFAGANLELALEDVFASYFSNSEKLTAETPFGLLFTFTTNAKVDSYMGPYRVDVKMKVQTPSGKVVYETYVEKFTRSNGDYNAYGFRNAYIAAIKEAMTQFMNNRANLGFQEFSLSGHVKTLAQLDFDQFFRGLAPASSGTGFAVNSQGQWVTAAHVVRECIRTELSVNGRRVPVTVEHASKLLDIAVLSGGDTPKSTVVFRSAKKNPQRLGESMFALGYPLSNFMSGSPTLTVGNVSSLGALKGAKGRFQFTAPIQPGNSGGPVVSYKGELLGMVASSLNAPFVANQTGSLPQNVNFAVDSGLMRRYLKDKGVAFQEGLPRLKFERATQIAEGYTVQVLCYK